MLCESPLSATALVFAVPADHDQSLSAVQPERLEAKVPLVTSSVPSEVVSPGETRENFAYGEVVPMPTLPVFLTTKSVVVADAVEDEIRKRFVFVSPVFAEIASLPHGVDVPMPTLPVE